MPTRHCNIGCRAGGVVVARARRLYTAVERRELWERWKRGESVGDIGRALDRAPSTVHGAIFERGGVPPRERRRSRLALSATATGVQARPQSRLGRCGRDEARADWSPHQIAGWLKLEYPEDETMRVSHETIVQARGALKRELVVHLRRTRSIRRPRAAKRGHTGQGQIVDAVSIRERPAEAEDRAVPGHWEGDLLAGAANSHIATLVGITKTISKIHGAVLNARTMFAAASTGASYSSGRSHTRRTRARRLQQVVPPAPSGLVPGVVSARRSSRRRLRASDSPRSRRPTRSSRPGREANRRRSSSLPCRPAGRPCG